MFAKEKVLNFILIFRKVERIRKIDASKASALIFSRSPARCPRACHAG